MQKMKKRKRNAKAGKSVKGGRGFGGTKSGGPRLPNSLLSQFPVLKPHNGGLGTDGNAGVDDEDINSDEGEIGGLDVYEYDEPMPEEESMKNRRYDHVDNFEYELPEKFEDSNVPSDDGEEEEEDYRGFKDIKRSSNSDVLSGNETEEEEDNARHDRMLQRITELPAEVFESRPQIRNVVSEAYLESEYNPTRDILDGSGHLTIQDLLNPIQGKPVYTEFRKRMQRLNKKSLTLQPPLPKVAQENLEREVAYARSKKDVTKWEPLVKRNREAPTIFFDEDINLGFSTVGAITSEFEPRTDFEKKMASLVHDSKVAEAHKEDGAKLLELNKISLEDVKDRQNRLAKMRSLLFRHEMKAKHIKKIKSKTFHRLLKKDKEKRTSIDVQMDPEAAKELAMKQEFKRAEERLRLKHKNNNKWATRILKRGLAIQDEQTQAAISEQLHQHALLTRKMNSMKDSSSGEDDKSSDEDDDDDDDNLDLGMKSDMASKLLTKAKEKTFEVMEDEDEMPKSGVFSLPFMTRSLAKKSEEARAEAKVALEEYDLALNQHDTDVPNNRNKGTSSGRRVFGASIKQPEEPSHVNNNIGRDSDDEDCEINKNVNVESARSVSLQKGVQIDIDQLNEEFDVGQDFESFDHLVRGNAPKTTYESAVFASGSWSGKKNPNVAGSTNRKPTGVAQHDSSFDNLKDVDDNDDPESGEEMVDGILSSSPKPDYELPSQADLIRMAFAGDDVEQEFEQEKIEVLNEENPEPEKTLSLPGWGQWTSLQEKYGLPSWITEEHENAKRRRDEALSKRKDAHLKNVIISEKINKKAENLHTKTLPFPYTSKEVFEQSIRVPIGPEYNPVTSIVALNRPEVVKTAGVIIKPIKFEEVNPHEKGSEQNLNSKRDTPKVKKNKPNNGKVIKATKTAKKKS
ncbi:hypothetical protein Scep_006083 [Stephania cephalantha]|uniref:U3 small nucleolar RNA-associated protein 14 n=1 Tax=Stephania cephalantha TaxID=152367 RepID=A0AAP0PNN5_9MAGN